jgi:hypothetical protein
LTMLAGGIKFHPMTSQRFSSIAMLGRERRSGSMQTLLLSTRSSFPTSLLISWEIWKAQRVRRFLP